MRAFRATAKVIFQLLGVSVQLVHIRTTWESVRASNEARYIVAQEAKYELARWRKGANLDGDFSRESIMRSIPWNYCSSSSIPFKDACFLLLPLQAAALVATRQFVCPLWRCLHYP